MKRAVRRKTARRKFPTPILLAAALLVFVGGIVASGGGTPDQEQTAQENLSAQISGLTESAPPTYPSVSIPVSDEPAPSESAPLPTPTPIPESAAPVPTESMPLSTPTPAPTPATPPPVESTPQPTPPPTSAPVLSAPAPTGDDWALILVNWEHTLPDGFSVPEFVQLRNGHAIDSRAYPALQDMMDGARAAGLQPLICSSYRSRGTQEQLFEQEVQSWLSRGYIREDAERNAATWVARPGTSEHQTGLAVDIVDMSYQILDEGQERTSVQQWLIAHCAEYGFILRYPTDKSNLTGVNYEPWHYRYVGVDAAREIMGRGLCLEEYLR